MLNIFKNDTLSEMFNYEVQSEAEDQGYHGKIAALKLLRKCSKSRDDHDLEEQRSHVGANIFNVPRKGRKTRHDKDIAEKLLLPAAAFPSDRSEQIGSEAGKTMCGSDCDDDVVSSRSAKTTFSFYAQSEKPPVDFIVTEPTPEAFEWEQVDTEDRLLTAEERESFFAPPPPPALEMKTTSTEFVPSNPAEQQAGYQSYGEPECGQPFEYEEPAYLAKAKTELCKFWSETGACKFGDKCAFAHGIDELQKKTHVASKYRMTTCTAYEQGYCVYGRRCQFMHSAVDFSDFEEQRTRFQNLLTENARIMQERIDQAADPDINQFNIAMSSRPRLAVFEHHCPQKRKKMRSKRGGQNLRGQRKPKNLIKETFYAEEA